MSAAARKPVEGMPIRPDKHTSRRDLGFFVSLLVALGVQTYYMNARVTAIETQQRSDKEMQATMIESLKEVLAVQLRSIEDKLDLRLKAVEQAIKESR